MNDSTQPLETDSAGIWVNPSDVGNANKRPAILSVVKDLPNIVTLLGLSSGVFGIYLALVGSFHAAMIAMLWAVLFDWYDGTVARRIPERSYVLRSVGIHLDSLADLVSSAVCPAIILLSYGNFSPWFFPGALALIMAGVVRLAYFDTFGVHGDGTIIGLSIDISPLVVALVFLLDGVLDQAAFAVLFYATVVVLAFLHVAPFRMRKMVGRWYYFVTAYVLIMTVTYFIIIGPS